MQIRHFLPSMSTVTAVGTASGSAYYLLLTDNFLNTSIASIILLIHDLEDVAPHAFVIGLLPIYIALTIFGSAVLGIYMARLVKFFSNRPAIRSFLRRWGFSNKPPSHHLH